MSPQGPAQQRAKRLQTTVTEMGRRATTAPAAPAAPTTVSTYVAMNITVPTSKMRSLETVPQKTLQAMVTQERNVWEFSICWAMLAPREYQY